jgi:creatinine amidohydrolase
MPCGESDIKSKSPEKPTGCNPWAGGATTVKFHELTWPLLRQVPRDSTVVLAPIAACEQHSRHLPTYTDTILVTAGAEGVEQRLPRQVLLLPSLWFGASHHHLPFGATLSAEAGIHVTMLCELLTPLLEDGYQRVLILNGHGGNIDTMHMALRRLQPRYRDRLLTGASYWELAEKELAALAEGPRKSMGHACEFETSMVLALRPELVRRDEIKDDPPADDPALRGLYIAEDFRQRTDHGAVGYPEKATAEKGRAFLNAAIDRTAEAVAALLRRPLPR